MQSFFVVELTNIKERIVSDQQLKWNLLLQSHGLTILITNHFAYGFSWYRTAIIILLSASLSLIPIMYTYNALLAYNKKDS
jgi:hypothetical protein